MKQLAYFSNLQGIENMENTPLCDIVRNCNIDRHAYTNNCSILCNIHKKQLFLFSRTKYPTTQRYKHEKQHSKLKLKNCVDIFKTSVYTCV